MQSITINIKPIAALPQTADNVFSFLLGEPWLIGMLLLAAVVLPLVLLTCAKPKHLAAHPRRAPHALNAHSALYAVPALLAVLAASPAVFLAHNSYAAGTPAVMINNATIDIVQGETSATHSFGINASGFTDGYDLSAQLNVAASALPAEATAVAIALDNIAVSDSEPTLVHSWREKAADPSLLTATITVPANAPAGDGYAVLVLDYVASDYAKYYTFQDITALDPNSVYFNPAPLTGTCAAAMQVYGTTGPLEDTIAVTDVRDGSVYRVRKLADNRCWMIDNLKFELTNGLVLSPATSNVAAPTTVYFTQDTTSTGAPLAGLAGNFIATGFNSRDGSATTTAPNQDVWGQNDPTLACASSAQALTSCGYLYNFYTATAGTAPQSQASGNASASICPSNWHLPSGGLSTAPYSDFATLDRAYGGTGAADNTAPAVLQSLWLAPFGAFDSFRSGVYLNNFYYQSTQAYFWSSTVASATMGYYLAVSETQDIPGMGSLNRAYGFAVRCVL